MEGAQLDFEDPSTSCLEKSNSTSQSPTMCPVVLEAAEQELMAEESAPTTDSDEIGVANIEMNNVFSLHIVDDTCTDQDIYSDESPLPGDWVNDNWTDDPSEHAEDSSSANGVMVSKVVNYLITSEWYKLDDSMLCVISKKISFKYKYIHFTGHFIMFKCK